MTSLRKGYNQSGWREDDWTRWGETRVSRLKEWGPNSFIETTYKQCDVGVKMERKLVHFELWLGRLTENCQPNLFQRRRRIFVTMGSSPDKGWDRLKAGEVWFEIGNDESNDLHNWPSGLVWDQGREVSGEPWFVIWDDIDNYQPSWLQEKRGSVWEVIKIMPKYGRIFRSRLFLCKIALWRRVLQSSIQLGCSGKASKGLKN